MSLQSIITALETRLANLAGEPGVEHRILTVIRDALSAAQAEAGAGIIAELTAAEITAIRELLADHTVAGATAHLDSTPAMPAGVAAADPTDV